VDEKAKKGAKGKKKVREESLRASCLGAICCIYCQKE
jgi:hypothetical protein